MSDFHKAKAIQGTAAALAAAVLGLTAFSPSAHSVEAGASVYAVAYVEVVPGKEKEASRLVLDCTAGAKSAAGAIEITALARDGYPNQFALLAQWQSQKSKEDYESTPAAQQCRDALAKLLSAAVDERIQGPLFVDPDKPSAAPPIIVMTHIDVIPPVLESARTRIKELVDKNRHRDANLRYDVLVQTNRQNHMTLIEGWKSQDDKNAESSTQDTISFRKDLLPMSGSPYDERTYRPLHD